MHNDLCKPPPSIPFTAELHIFSDKSIQAFLQKMTLWDFAWLQCGQPKTAGPWQSSLHFQAPPSGSYPFICSCPNPDMFVSPKFLHANWGSSDIINIYRSQLQYVCTNRSIAAALTHWKCSHSKWRTHKATKFLSWQCTAAVDWAGCLLLHFCLKFLPALCLSNFCNWTLQWTVQATKVPFPLA